jgi:hypothetical protein
VDVGEGCIAAAATSGSGMYSGGYGSRRQFKSSSADRSFDAALAHFAIHNVPSREGRREAIREIVPTLKQGGQVAISDLHGASAAAIITTGMNRSSMAGWKTVRTTSRPIEPTTRSSRSTSPQPANFTARPSLSR